jgi:hypothetical protein
LERQYRGRTRQECAASQPAKRPFYQEITRMIRTAARSTVFPYWILLGLSFAAFSTVSHAEDGAQVWLVVEPSPGMPKCDEFFDEWETPGAPAGMMAMMGFSREVFAAKDCLTKNDIPMACKHWRGLLTVMEKVGSPLNERRGDVEEQVRYHKCE